MKKFALFIILLIFALVFIPFSGNNPYSGLYHMKGNNNITLNLKNDNSFELIDNLSKNEEYTSGKYQIKDNVISLKFDNNNAEFLKGVSSGKVEGSNIYLGDSQNLLFIK